MLWSAPRAAAVRSYARSCTERRGVARRVGASRRGGSADADASARVLLLESPRCRARVVLRARRRLGHAHGACLGIARDDALDEHVERVARVQLRLISVLLAAPLRWSSRRCALSRWRCTACSSRHRRLRSFSLVRYADAPTIALMKVAPGGSNLTKQRLNDPKRG